MKMETDSVPVGNNYDGLSPASVGSRCIFGTTTFPFVDHLEELFLKHGIIVLKMFFNDH